MAFVWDLLQQFQLQKTKSRAKSAKSAAKSAEFRSKVAETRAKSVEGRTRDLELRVEELETEMAEVRTTFAVLLDRLERRFGTEAEQLLDTSAPVSGRIKTRV
jgi:hypothetical protein